MNEQTPRPDLRLVPPCAENAPGPDRPVFLPTPPRIPELPAERERFPLPDYSQASDKELNRAQIREELRLFRADLGHFFTRALVLSSQLYAIIYHGADIPFDWQMDITGFRPDLDEKECVATERIQALADERRFRRSIRQQRQPR